MKSRGRATIEVEVEDPDLKISADRFHLTHALDNLVDNALKYSGETVRIRLSARHAGKGVELRVADNGIGIDRTAQAHIFEKFYRVPTGDRHDVKGIRTGPLLCVADRPQARRRDLGGEHSGLRLHL